MTAHPPPDGITEADYEAIHAAVVETARGRWFLAEFARRAREAEGERVLEAIARLEASVMAFARPAGSPLVARLAPAPQPAVGPRKIAGPPARAFDTARAREALAALDALPIAEKLAFFA